MSTATPLLTTSATSIAPRTSEVLRVLTWRFVRHGWQSILPPVLLICGLPTLVFLLMRIAASDVVMHVGEDAPSMRRLYFIFSMGIIPTLILVEMFQVRPLYALPLTTRRIVHTQLTLGILYVVAAHLLSALYYLVVFGALVPLMGPLLFLVPMLFVCAGIGALWSDAVWWRPLLGFGLLAAFVGWLGRRLSDDSLLAGGTWFTPTAVELFLLVLMGVAGYLVTYRTAVRDRCGDTGSWGDLEESLYQFGRRIGSRWPSRTRRELTSHAGAEASPAGDPRSVRRRMLAAYASYEWQTRGLVLPICVLGLGLLSLVGAYYEPQEWFQAYLVSLPMLLVFAMGINGYFVGLVDGSKMNGEMDRYRASRPLSDAQLAYVLLKNGLVSTGVALLISVGLALIVYLYALVCGHSQSEIWNVLYETATRPYGGGVVSYLVMIVGGGLAGWAAMGLNLSCLATGRHWIVPTLWLTGMIWMVSNILLGTQLTEEQRAGITIGMLLLIAGIAASGTIVCYRLSIARGLIPRSSWIVGGVLWCLGAGIFIAGFRHLEQSWTTLLVLIGLGSLVALPIASVPLAVWWNRHR